MKVSLNALRQFTDVDLPVAELLTRVNAQLGGVEEVIDIGARYEGALIVKVVACEKHPNADKLHVCLVDDGGKTNDVPRTKDGFVQVVCGAPNVHADMLAVWLPPGMAVPASHADSEPFVLGARELRGVLSQGMLASPKELALGDSHDGILEVPASDNGVKPGISFAAVYGLDDTIIDIENKMFTHRPDCFGVLGVAREVAGIQHKRFISPKWYTALPTFTSGEGLELSVKNESENVPRFMSVAVKDVTVGPSPLWLQAELARLGGKPINNVVDVTNYVMLLTAQPLHAYDYEKLRGSTLGARQAKRGETVELLNGKTYKLDTNDTVIVDGAGAVGLGGIMGGSTSEVSDATKHIVIECANFDMYATRRSSMRHGLFTDAVTRFNKGQSPLQNDYVLAYAVSLLQKVAGGEVASQVFDLHGGKPTKQLPPIKVTAGFINERLGLTLKASEIIKLLQNVEFTVTDTQAKKDVELKVTVPFWRTDIVLPEDIVEEVGRLYGFDKLPRELPRRTMKAPVVNPLMARKREVRDSLYRAGANEVLTYSFVHEKMLLRAGQDPAHAFRLSNALSPDLHYFRLSVLPSLLDKVHANIKAGHDEFILFELGKGHHKHSTDKDGLPNEVDLLELVYTSKKAREGAAYYRMRRQVETLLHDLGIKVSFEAITEESPHDGMAPYDTSRSAYVKTLDGAFLGVVGELKGSVRNAFKLPEYSAAATVDIHSLQLAGRSQDYRPLSRFPRVSQDVSLKVPDTVSHGDLMEAVSTATKNFSSTIDCRVDISSIDLYRPKGGSEVTHTFRLIVTPEHRTLSDKEVAKLVSQVVAQARPLGAEQA